MFLGVGTYTWEPKTLISKALAEYISAADWWPLTRGVSCSIRERRSEEWQSLWGTARNCPDPCHKSMSKNRIRDLASAWKTVPSFKLLRVKSAANTRFLKNGLDMVPNYIIFTRKGKAHLPPELGSGTLRISPAGAVIIAKLLSGLTKPSSNTPIFLGWSSKTSPRRKIRIEEPSIISARISCNVAFSNSLANTTLAIAKALSCTRHG